MNIIQILKFKFFNFKNETNEQQVFYVAGSQNLPPPLETKEEEELIRRFEDNGDDEARKMLVERNLRLVVYIAKKFENTGMDLEEAGAIRNTRQKDKYSCIYC